MLWLRRMQRGLGSPIVAWAVQGLLPASMRLSPYREEDLALAEGASLREWHAQGRFPHIFRRLAGRVGTMMSRTVLPIVLRLSLSVPRRRFSRCVSTGLQTHQNRGPFRTGFSGVDENPEAHSFRAVQRLRASSLVRTRACRFAGRHASLRADPLADGCEAGWIFRGANGGGETGGFTVPLRGSLPPALRA